MKRLITLLIAAAGMLIATSAAADPPKLTVASECVVSADQFTLGEIATIEAAIDVKPRLAAITLGMSPRPGLNRAFTRAQVETRLRQHGFDPRTITLAMPSTVTVIRDAQKIEPDLIVKTARDAFAKQFPEAEPRAVVIKAPRPLSILRTAFTCEADTTIRRSGETYTVTVRVEQDGHTAGSYEITFRDEHPAAAMLIKPGDPINVEHVAGGLVITVTGQARTAGAMGDTVTAYLPGTRRTVKAVVVGERTARLTNE